MMPSGGPGDEFSAANLPDEVHMAAHVAPVEIQAVAVRIDARNLAAIELSEQNICERLHNRSRSALEHIRNARVEAVFGQADEAIGVGKGAEFNVNCRYFSSRLQFPEDAAINLHRRLEKQGALESGKLGCLLEARRARLHFSRI